MVIFIDVTENSRVKPPPPVESGNMTDTLRDNLETVRDRK